MSAGPGAPRAILRQRCPRCRRGAIFRGAVTMNETCPACGTRFEREPGYFVGAMYLSYALALPLLVLGMLIVHLLRPGWSALALLGAAVLLCLPLVPWLFRVSRVLWMYLDRAVDPKP